MQRAASTSEATAATGCDDRPDAEIVAHVVQGNVAELAVLMRRYNRRLFRVVRAVVRDDAEAEDLCQEAWLRAYRSLAGLHNGSAFASWLAKIGLRCALERRALAQRIVSFDELDAHDDDTDAAELEDQLEHRDLARRVERALDELLPSHRAVVLLRDVEHMTTAEVADVLGVTEQNVRVRLHRARASLRERLTQDLGADFGDVFRFEGERCGRLTRTVLGALIR